MVGGGEGKEGDFFSFFLANSIHGLKKATSWPLLNKIKGDERKKKLRNPPFRRPCLNCFNLTGIRLYN